MVSVMPFDRWVARIPVLGAVREHQIRHHQIHHAIPVVNFNFTPPYGGDLCAGTRSRRTASRLVIQVEATRELIGRVISIFLMGQGLRSVGSLIMGSRFTIFGAVVGGALVTVDGKRVRVGPKGTSTSITLAPVCSA